MTSGELRGPPRGYRTEIIRGMTRNARRRPRRGFRRSIRRGLPRECWPTRNAGSSRFNVFRLSQWPCRLGLLVIAAWLGAGGSAAAIGQPERALRNAMHAYRAGDYQTAAGAFADAAELRPGNAKLLYNAGAAAYRQGDLSGARRLLQASINSGATDQLAAAGHLALGHTWMAEAEQLAETGPAAALPALERAIENYQRTLRVADGHEAAAYHLERARAWLDELRRLQQQQQNQQQSQGEQAQQPEQDGEQEQPAQQQQQQDQEQQPRQPDPGGADQSEAAQAPAAAAEGRQPEQDADDIARQIIAAEEAIAALLDRRRQLEPVARDW